MDEADVAGLLALVDPELREGATAMRAAAIAATPMTRAGLAARRARIAGLAGPIDARVPAAPRTVPGPPDNPRLGVWLVNARAGGPPRPAILHLHGGGFTAGSARDAVPWLQPLATRLDCVIVSVDYRLAPETRGDRSLEDNHAALAWLHAEADALGVDRARIAVMGESGGGGHAGLLALAARDRGGPPIRLLALSYPMLDDRTGTAAGPPVPPHTQAFGWNADANRFGWTSLLGRAPGGADATGVPARVADLAGLPPTWAGTGGLDLFAAETLAFAGRLNAAGVPTELSLVPGAYHGFDLVQPDAAVSRRFAAARAAALARAFAGP